MMLRSHYTALNFLPKFLFEQFRRFANLYVLTFVASVCRVCAAAGRLPEHWAHRNVVSGAAISLWSAFCKPSRPCPSLTASPRRCCRSPL